MLDRTNSAMGLYSFYLNVLILLANFVVKVHLILDRLQAQKRLSLTLHLQSV